MFFFFLINSLILNLLWTQKRSVERQKMKVSGPEFSKLGQGRNSLQSAKHAWLYSDILQDLKGETLNLSALDSQTERILISASAVPDCCRMLDWTAPSRQHCLGEVDPLFITNAAARLRWRPYIRKRWSWRLCQLSCVVRLKPLWHGLCWKMTVFVAYCV